MRTRALYRAQPRPNVWDFLRRRSVRRTVGYPTVGPRRLDTRAGFLQPELKHHSGGAGRQSVLGQIPGFGLDASGKWLNKSDVPSLRFQGGQHGWDGWIQRGRGQRHNRSQ